MGSPTKNLPSPCQRCNKSYLSCTRYSSWHLHLPTRTHHHKCFKYIRVVFSHFILPKKAHQIQVSHRVQKSSLSGYSFRYKDWCLLSSGYLAGAELPHRVRVPNLTSWGFHHRSAPINTKTQNVCTQFVCWCPQFCVHTNHPHKHISHFVDTQINNLAYLLKLLRLHLSHF